MSNMKHDFDVGKGYVIQNRNVPGLEILDTTFKIENFLAEHELDALSTEEQNSFEQEIQSDISRHIETYNKFQDMVAHKFQGYDDTSKITACAQIGCAELVKYGVMTITAEPAPRSAGRTIIMADERVYSCISKYEREMRQDMGDDYSRLKALVEFNQMLVNGLHNYTESQQFDIVNAAKKAELVDALKDAAKKDQDRNSGTKYRDALDHDGCTLTESDIQNRYDYARTGAKHACEHSVLSLDATSPSIAKRLTL